MQVRSLSGKFVRILVALSLIIGLEMPQLAYASTPTTKQDASQQQAEQQTDVSVTWLSAGSDDNTDTLDAGSQSAVETTSTSNGSDISAASIEDTQDTQDAKDTQDASGGLNTQSIQAGLLAETFSGGTGTAADPYLLSNADDMVRLSALIADQDTYTSYYKVNYKLTSDITLPSTYTPIGTGRSFGSDASYNAVHSALAGTFDGDGHTITIDINTTASYAGVIGYAENATIKNLVVKGSVTKPAADGSHGSAGVVGYASNCTIDRCSNFASVSAKNATGGIVGNAINIKVTRCSNYGDITATGVSTTGNRGRSGGIVGDAASTNLENCYNQGTVAGGDAGGLVGYYAIAYSSGRTSSLVNCYNAGAIEMNTYSTYTAGKGAIIGFMYNSSTNYQSQNSVRNTYASTSCGYAMMIGSETAERQSYFGEFDAQFMEDASMKGDAFLETLGSEFKATQSYPVLDWEVGDGTPVIATPLADSTYVVGDTATYLRADALLPDPVKAGWNGTLAYQWYSSNLVTNNKTGSPVNGATNQTFQPPTDKVGTFYYYCVVTNNFDGGNNPIARTNCATIIVTSGSQPTQIEVTPTNNDVVIDQIASDSEAKLEVQADPFEGEGIGQLTYKWQQASDANGSWTDVNDNAARGTVSAKGDASYSPRRSALGTTYYRCVVINTYEGVLHEHPSSAIKVTVGPVHITNASDHKRLAEAVNTGKVKNTELVVELDNDITVPNASAIGTATNPFIGTFEGNNHRATITINEPSSDYQGFFGYAQDATIKNFIVAGSVSGSNFVGGVAGFATGTKKGVGADGYANAYYGTTFYRVGNEAAVTGEASNSTIGGELGTGGIAGGTDRNTTFTQCFNRGAISGAHNTGGIVGRARASVYGKFYAIACYNTGTITSSQQAAGGIVGYFKQDTSYSSGASNISFGYIAQCYNAGAITFTTSSNPSYYGAISGSTASGQCGYDANRYIENLLSRNGLPLSDKGSQWNSTFEPERNVKYAEADFFGADGLKIVNALPAYNTSIDNAFKIDEADQNRGFPILTWEPLTQKPYRAYTFVVDPAQASVEVVNRYGLVVSPEEGPQVNAEGKLEVTYHLSAGTYSYVVEPDDTDSYVKQTDTITVPELDANESETKVITLERSKMHTTFNVTSEGGASVNGVKVTATHAVSKLDTVGTGDGATIAVDLLYGSYTYTVSAPKHNSKTGTLEADSASKTVDVELVPCVQATIKIVDKDGNTVEDAQAVFTDAKGNAVSFEEEGGYTYIPDGSYTYQVDTVGYERKTGSIEVDGGKIDGQREATVTITLDNLASWDGTKLQEPRQSSDGTYLISNAAELAWFSNEVNTKGNEDGKPSFNAKVIADISLNDDTMSNQFTPIGSGGVRYAGHFDGGGHTISGLFIPGGSNTGLFGSVYSGYYNNYADVLIENVVVSGNISGSDYVGGIVGYVYGDATIKNCGNHTSIRGVKYVGGIVGGMYQSSGTLTIDACYNKGAIRLITSDSSTGTEGSCGGIVGYVRPGVVTNCYNLGKIESNGYATGGIVGMTWVNTLDIQHCYNNGVVDGSAFYYGSNTYDPTIVYDYYATAFGGIVGYYATTIPITVGEGCYWGKDTAERGIGYNNNYGTYVSDATNTFTSHEGLTKKLDTTGTYFVDPTDPTFNDGFPRLVWEIEESTIVEPEPDEDGSKEHPWIIDSYQKLIEFQNAVNSGHSYAGEYVKLVADIDCVADRGELEAFTGIGYGESSAGAFSGKFDGGGHTVSNIEVYPSTADTAGFFRNLRAATIEHLNVQGKVYGSQDGFVGGLAGYAYNTTIRDVHVEADVDTAGVASGSMGRVAGIVGYVYQTTIETSLFHGEVGSGGSGIACGTASSNTLVANYYSSNTAVGGMTGTDIAGKAEAYTDVFADELAWKLNTANGSKINSGVWGNVKAPDRGVQFANDDVRAVFKVTVSTTGITVDVSPEYAREGDTITYTNLKAKKGYRIKGGALVTSLTDPASSTGNVYTDNTGKTQGTFTMPEADVELSADVEFDSSTLFNIRYEVVSDDSTTRNATVQITPASAVAGAEVSILVDNIDSNSRVLKVLAYEDDTHAAQLNVATVSIGAKYKFVMPRSDAYIKIVLCDVATGGDYWPSDTLLDAMAHISDSRYWANGNYTSAILRIDGAEGTGLETEQSYSSNRSTILETVYSLENRSTILDRYHYRSTYSIYDGTNTDTLDLQGVKVYDYLVLMGMSPDLPDTTPVTFVNKEGDTVGLTLGALKSHAYNSYDADGNLTAQGQPVIIAYGENGQPLPMDVAKADASGNAISYEQATPLMLVVGQTAAKNANETLYGVNQIIVGATEANDHHEYSVYKNLAKQGMTVQTYLGSTRIKNDVHLVSSLEELASQNPQYAENHKVWGSLWNGTDCLMSSSEITTTDAYEGVSLPAILEQSLLEGHDPADATVDFYSRYGYGEWVTASVPLTYILGGSNNDYDGNTVVWGYAAETGVVPYVAFGKNGFPLVENAYDSGYEDSAYNRWGPLIGVLPAHEAYGVSGGDAAAHDAMLVTYLTKIVIRYDDHSVDKTALNDAIKAATEDKEATATSSDGKDLVDGTVYTNQAARDILDAAIAEAQKIYADPTATQDQVDAATKKMTDAKKAFDNAKKTAKVDKTALKNNTSRAASDAAGTDKTKPVAIVSTNGANVDGEKWWVTPQEQKALENAVAAAQKVINNSNATQEQVNAATKAIVNAMATYDAAKKYGSKIWYRLWGTNRYDTMASIVEEGWKNTTGKTVIVATGANFKDALAASGLAGLYNAPVVLTPGNQLCEQAKKELKALKPSKVFIAGGPLAVTNDVKRSIEKLTGASVKRLDGKTSASTSAALAIEGAGQWADATAVIATNKSFKDALSVAPIAYAKHYPILLADNGKSLNADVLAALKACGIKRVIIVGGKLAVTDNVEKQLKQVGISIAERLAGANGVATSAAIATWGIKHGMKATRMGVATSQNFPDALAGAALCGHNNAVIVLADDKALLNSTFPAGYRNSIRRGYVFGGELAVGKNTWNALNRSTAR